MIDKLQLNYNLERIIPNYLFFCIFAIKRVVNYIIINFTQIDR